VPHRDSLEDYFSSHTVDWTLQFLERRWGLTLVSFLALKAQEPLFRLQQDIAKTVVGKEDNQLLTSREYVEFHDIEHIHGTHFVLTESQPNGPVRVSDTIRGDPLQMLLQIEKAAADVGPIEVEATRLEIFNVFILLCGECVDVNKNRQKLLTELNRTLMGTFGVKPRPFENDPGKFGEMHFTLGVIKRSPPKGYSDLKERLNEIPIEKTRFTLDRMSLVHHRHNSLKPPHEGIINFTLGSSSAATLDQMYSQLHMR